MNKTYKCTKHIRENNGEHGTITMKDKKKLKTWSFRKSRVLKQRINSDESMNESKNKRGTPSVRKARMKARSKEGRPQ